MIKLLVDNPLLLLFLIGALGYTTAYSFALIVKIVLAPLLVAFLC